MVGEAAGPHRIVNAIALDSATSAATRMVGPLLGGMAFEWLHMKGAYTLTALVQFLGAFAMSGLVYAQVTRRLNLMRIPHEIVEGLRFAWTKPTILLVFGVTIVTNAFAFAYSGLVAPLGLAAFNVSPALVGLLAAAEPLGALIGGALIAMGLVRMDRRLAFAGGAALFMVALIVMALSPSFWFAFRNPCPRRLRHRRIRQHAIDPDADRSATRGALAPDGSRHGLYRYRPARPARRWRNLRPDRPAQRRDRDGRDRVGAHGSDGVGVETASRQTTGVIVIRTHREGRPLHNRRAASHPIIRRSLAPS